MALPLKRTLGELRAEIQTRLGFGMSGQAGIVNSPLITSFLRSAQEQLYSQFDWRELCVSSTVLTGQEQRFYDYPVDCNVERIQGIHVLDGAIWIELVEGITMEQRGFSDIFNVPLRYQRGGQLEVWPIPNGQYSLRFDYVKTLEPFSDSDDRTSIPSEPVFLFALADAKAHYRQPDADRYTKQRDDLLNRLKAQHRGKSVWTKETPCSLRNLKDESYRYPR